MRVDWFRLLADLKRAGMSTYLVAELVGVPRTTLAGYPAGSEPKHSIGEALIGLWMSACGTGRDSLPLTRIELSSAKIR